MTYEVDDLDEVVELHDLPRASAGAPMPLLLADEDRLLVGYSLFVPGRDDEPAAIVVYEGVLASTFGAPNDEALAGHPLAARGLGAYRAFEVRRSSWIRRLEERNRVHRHHRPEAYARFRHFIHVFHDTTFECVAVRYSAILLEERRTLLERMVAALRMR